MKNYEELIEELNTLPRGYISYKRIKGKKYAYLQYSLNGKIISTYVNKKEIKSLALQLEKRKEIENELKKYNKNSSFSISKRMSELTGSLMSGDVVVASFKNGICTFLDENKCPLYIRRTKDVRTFLKNRTLDLTRPNARILLKILGLQNKDEQIALYSYGATISDNYWFKPSGSKKKYKDIVFTNDIYSSLALEGKIMKFPSLGSPTAELTNIGSFEKAWKLINNEWWLYKKGNEDNIFSELFAYYFSELFGVKSALYEYDKGFIRSKNFADKYNFESIYSLMGNNENYEDVFNCLYKINKEIAKQYIHLLMVDLIVYNVDRHNQNYGLLRNKKTGKIVSLAPNFDNNLALLAYNKTLDQDPKKDGMFKLFFDFIETNKTAKSLFKSINIPMITRNNISLIIKKIPILKDEEKIISFIISRVEFLRYKQLTINI